MANEFLRYLLSLTVASSVSISAAMLIRRPARCIFGASACYSLWLLVPVAMLAALLPHAAAPSSMPWNVESVSALSHVLGPLSPGIGPSGAAAPSIHWQTLVVSLWCTGAVLFAAYLASQQHAFVKSLGRLSGSRRVFRAARPEGCPVLLGVLRPKIVLPADFDSRYTRLERLLIFSHERTHLRRGDAGCNGIVALMRCTFWFNPFVHLASNCFRVDQEFACDAAVMRDYPASRRAYAAAMLKTQLADLALPIGCHWRSAQALKSRIQMLKRQIPSRRLRVCGTALTAFLSLVLGCTTWVTQPPNDGTKPRSAAVPAPSPFAGPVDIAADEVSVRHVAAGQSVMELQGNGRLVVPRGVLMRVSAERSSVERRDVHILQGHVRMTFDSPAKEREPQTMLLETERAVIMWRPDGSVVVKFEQATVQQMAAAGVLAAPLSLTPARTAHVVTPTSATPSSPIMGQHRLRL
jgi:bla regulator protein blaR1